jgi:hypothetical protein
LPVGGSRHLANRDGSPGATGFASILPANSLKLTYDVITARNAIGELAQKHGREIE